jgi:hypothetical protein
MLDRIRGLGQRRQALLGLLLLVTVMAPPNPLTFFVLLVLGVPGLLCLIDTILA